MTVRVCLSEIGPQMPIELKKDICMEIRDPPDRGPKETRFFSAKAYWFRGRREIDIDSSYLQVGLRLGLIKMFWGSVEIKSHSQFKAMYKAMFKWKYVASPYKTFWAGLIYEEQKPTLRKNVYCKTYEECIPFRGHIYKQPIKFVPQILLGWAKKHYGVRTIDYIAAHINKYLRQVCAPSNECAAHVHDGLMYFDNNIDSFRPPKLLYTYKVEERAGWSWAGVVAPGDPPRFWGFMPSRPNDVLLINRALTEAPDPETAYRQVEHLCLFPHIFERSLGAGPAPGLVDLEYLIRLVHPEGLAPENIIII